MNAAAHLAFFSSFRQSSTSVQGLVPPTFIVDFFTSGKTFWKCPHARKCVSPGNPVTLTINITHHELQNKSTDQHTGAQKVLEFTWGSELGLELNPTASKF